MTYRLAFSLMLSVLLVGCAGSGTGSDGRSVSARADVPGYLGRSQYSAAFIQWTRTGTALNGTLTEAYLDNTNQVGQDSGPIAGVTNGESVTLHTSDSYATVNDATIFSGALHGSSLVLSYPGSNGALSTETFHAASVSDYNAAVNDLNREAAAARRAVARATAVVDATSCAVLTRFEAEIAITVRGPGHWSICSRIVHSGQGLNQVSLGGDFDIQGYSRDCASRYAGDTITVYDYNGPSRQVERACAAFSRHSLPALNGNAG